MDLLTDHVSTPLFPGAEEDGPMVTAIVFDVRLEAPGIHTRSHFAGELLTHDFFSREAMHAALFDIWQSVQPAEPESMHIPYSSTPLIASSPSYMTLHYASTRGWGKTPLTCPHLTLGTMQAMEPGTLLRAAVWGDPAQLPDIFPGRAFNIGKRRATARVIHASRQDVRIGTRQSSDLVLPVQIPRQELFEPRYRQMAYRPRADTGRYVLLDLWLDERVPRFVLDGVTVPALDFAGAMGL